MSEETKKVEQIEEEAKQEVQPAELSEEALDSVAGGKNYYESRSNTAKIANVATVTPTKPPSPAG